MVAHTDAFEQRGSETKIENNAVCMKITPWAIPWRLGHTISAIDCQMFNVFEAPNICGIDNRSVFQGKNLNLFLSFQ